MFTIALNGYEKTFKDCIDSQREYCNKNNYEYVVIDYSPRAMQPIEAAWIKIPLILSALKNKYQWVAFIDSDCEIREFTPPFDQYLSEKDDEKSLFISLGKSQRLNSGVMIIRNSPESVKFFEDVYGFIDSKVPDTDKTPFENGHIIYFGKNNSNIFVLDHNTWNNNSVIDDQSYIQHYSSGLLREYYFKKYGHKKPSRIITKILSLFKSKQRLQQGKAYFEGILSIKIKELVTAYVNKYPAYFKAL